MVDCPNAEGTTRRHNTLRDDIWKVLTTYPFTQRVSCERPFPQDIELLQPQQRRMVLVESTADFHEQPLALDISIACPYAIHSLSPSAKSGGAAATIAENRKLSKYSSASVKAGWRFSPLALD